VLPFEFAFRPGPNGSIERPQALRLPCPYCGRENRFPFPSAERRLGAIHLFGDEAEQSFNSIPAYLYVYTFVAVHAVSRPLIENRLVQAKGRLRPDRDPRDWVLHAADIRSPQWREENGVDVPTPTVNKELCGLMEALGEVDGSRVVSATVFPPFDLKRLGAGEKTRQELRNQVRSCWVPGW
jgi:hypothetical protein